MLPTIRVTLIDDHRIVMESLAVLLETAGIEVVGQFTDPAAFLAVVDQLAPDVAIIDIALGPHTGAMIDGFEVLRALGHAHPSVASIVLSALREPEMVDQAYRLGAAAYLYKLDADKTSLLKAIQAARAHQRWAGPEVIEQALAGRNVATAPHPLAQVTSREREVLACIAAGADNLKIAILLGMSERTVRAHVSSLYRKLRRENRTELALLARDLGIRPRAE